MKSANGLMQYLVRSLSQALTTKREPVVNNNNTNNNTFIYTF